MRAARYHFPPNAPLGDDGGNGGGSEVVLGALGGNGASPAAELLVVGGLVALGGAALLLVAVPQLRAVARRRRAWTYANADVHLQRQRVERAVGGGGGGGGGARIVSTRADAVALAVDAQHAVASGVGDDAKTGGSPQASTALLL